MVQADFYTTSLFGASMQTYMGVLCITERNMVRMTIKTNEYPIISYCIILLDTPQINKE